MRRVFVIAILCVTAGPAGAVGLAAGTTLQITARATYDTEPGVPDFVESSVILTVLQVAGAAIDSNGAVGATIPGADNCIPLKITNTGNGPDSYQLSVQSSNGWEVALVHDDNADGIHQPEETDAITDTGLMVADGYCPCFARVTVPEGVYVGDVITVTTTSRLDAAMGWAEVQFVLAAPPEIETSLSLSAAPSPAYVGQTAALSGKISPAIACELDVTVTAPDGAVTTSQGNTADDGSFAASLTVQDAGSYTIRVAFPGGAGYAGCWAECSIQANPRIHTSLSATASPPVLTVGATVTVTGSLTPAAQSVLSLACTDPGGVVTRTDVSTDSSGSYTWRQAAGSTGDWMVTVSYAGSVSCEPAVGTTGFTVSEPPSAPHEIVFTAGPTVSPVKVASAGAAQCSAAATDSQEHSVVYQWSDGGVGGAFAPNAAAQNPVYTAPANTSGRDAQVILSCTAACAESSSIHRSGAADLTVESVAVPICTVTGPARPTNANPITFNISFSQTVTGLAAHSIVIGGGRAGDLLGDGAAYTLSVIPNGDGTVTCRVPAGAARNSDGYGNSESNTASVTFSATAPDVVITNPTTDPTCVRVGAELDLWGTASLDTAGLTWANETTGESGQCAGTVMWLAEQIPLQVGDNTICVTATDTAGNSGADRISITRLDVDVDALRDAWRGVAMVSVPVIPDLSDPKLVVRFQDWKWCRYSSLSGFYVYYPDASTYFDPPAATPGRGFCAVFDDPAEVPCGTVPPQDEPAVIHLYPSWNLFGQPFLSAVTWELDGILVRDRRGTVKTLRESEIVMPNAWGWRQDESNPYTGAYYPICDAGIEPDAAHDLPPWQAFWVYSRTECDLILPPPGSEAQQLPSSQSCGPWVCPRVFDCPPMPPPPPE